MAIPNADNDVLEAEVEIFSDAVLVPEASLRHIHSETLQELKKAGREIDELSPTSKEAIAGRMARKFLVSTRTLERRLTSLALKGWCSEADSRLLDGFTRKHD